MFCVVGKYVFIHYVEIVETEIASVMGEKERE